MLSPDRMYMESSRLSPDLARSAAEYSVFLARQEAPKLTGWGARQIVPIYGPGFFGLHFPPHMWFQNSGTRGQTMRWLSGKTVPMWIDDPTGKERQRNPKAKTRTTESGRVQVLIFRRAAKFGERKLVRKNVGGIIVEKFVPKSFPGAPGRIAMREAPAPFTTNGKLGGRIAKGNVGVRWYFPGLYPRGFLPYALNESAKYFGIMGNIRIGYNYLNEAQELTEIAQKAKGE